MMINLRAEKKHCRLLKSYADASSIDLADFDGILASELRHLVIDIGTGITENNIIALEHRLTFRRLRDRIEMLNACKRMKIFPHDSEEVRTHREAYNTHIRYADGCLLKILELQSQGALKANSNNELRLPL